MENIANSTISEQDRALPRDSVPQSYLLSARYCLHIKCRVKCIEIPAVQIVLSDS